MLRGVGGIHRTHLAQSVDVWRFDLPAAGIVTAFDALFTALNQAVLESIEDPAPAGVAREDFAFFAAYFSNYIEGTTFEVNQAGSTYFVVPELVVGSLREGFERIRALPHPLAQAITIMFVSVVAKVHPFSDGNGDPLISALSRAQRWSAAFDYSLPRAQLRESWLE